MFQEHLWFLDYICGVEEDWGIENTLLTSCLSLVLFLQYLGKLICLEKI